jgi:UDP-glucose 4-epimerase
MKSLLVIGGAGYIGSHVVRALLDERFSVTVFDNMSSGREENLFPEARFIRGDILDYDALRTAMGGGFDGLIHLAAFKAAGESMLLPEKYSRNNIIGAMNLLNAASETGIKNIVFSSSAAVYGDPVYLPLDEKHPTEPPTITVSPSSRSNASLTGTTVSKESNTRPCATSTPQATTYKAGFPASRGNPKICCRW